MAKGYIYKYTFPDGKVYIGQTRRPPELRHREHFDEKIGKLNSKFWEAYQTIGMPEFEIIETIENKRVQDLVPLLNEAETKFIQLYQATNPQYGYNVRARAYVATPRDAVLDEEFQRRWIEVAEWWYPIYDRVKEKCFETFEPLNEEELEFCDEILKGNIFDSAVKDLKFDFRNLKGNTEDARFFFSEALEYAEMFFCEDNWEEIRSYIEANKEDILANNKPENTIVQIDKNGKIVKEYIYPSDIKEEMGLSNMTNIYNALEGKQRHAYGYVWRYKKDLESPQSCNKIGQLDIDFGE